MFRSALCIVALFTVAAHNAQADLVYDGGSPPRPTSFTNVPINGTTYNVDITYNNNGETNPLRVGDLPDTDIYMAQIALKFELNGDGVSNSPTTIFFMPNTDRISTPTSFNTDGFLFDYSTNAGAPWFVTRGGYSVNAQWASSPAHGFAQFTAIPEPSAFFCVGLVGLGMCGKFRSKHHRSSLESPDSPANS